MRLILLRLGFCFLVSAFASAAADQETRNDFKFGARPPGDVFDPAGILMPTQRQEIAAPLAIVRENEKIDILVVILPEIGDAPARYVAENFRKEWSKGAINAVVLHVPGREDSPWIVPGELINRVVKTEKLQESIDSGQMRARAETGDFAKIRAAAVEATDIMRYWSGGAAIRSEAMINERLRRQLAYERKQRLVKLAAAVGLAGAIPIILGAVIFFTKMKNIKPRVFPPIRKTARLGAPYAGGNNSVTRLK